METLPPYTRLGFIQQNPDKSNQCHPDFKDYKNYDKFWKINDIMENVAKEQGNITKVLCQHFTKNSIFYFFLHLILLLHEILSEHLLLQFCDLF